MAAAHYAQTGELPTSLFKGGRKGASLTGKRKRKASGERSGGRQQVTG